MAFSLDSWLQQAISTAFGPGAWTGLTLPTNVVSRSGFAPVAACVDGFGVVRVRGGITNNTGATISSGSALATLPSGMRPTDTLEFPAFFVALTTTYAVQVLPSGIITPATGLGLANGGSIEFDVIKFLTSA